MQCNFFERIELCSCLNFLKNILPFSQKILPLVVFFVDTREPKLPFIDLWYKFALTLYTKRNSQHSHTWSNNILYFPKCIPSSTKPFFFPPCLSKNGIVHQYASSWNDNLRSLPIIFVFDYQNLSSYLYTQIQSLNIVYVAILILFFHEWLPCINILLLTRI